MRTAILSAILLSIALADITCTTSQVYLKVSKQSAASWASDHPELATALGVGIPGALLAGAGALALRRRQRNVKDK